MQFLLAGLIALFLIGLVVGAGTGRVNLRSCCSPADPSRDLRMRDAYAPESSDQPGHTDHSGRST